MSDVSSFKDENETLKKQLKVLKDENESLKHENERLKGKLQIFTSHPSRSVGERGERIMEEILKAVRTTKNEDVDFILPNGKKLEVKYSNLTKAHPNRPNPVLRWAWSKPLGSSGNKEYNNLILIGATSSGHEIFDVPISVVQKIINSDSIFLNASKKSARGNGKLLWEYNITPEELETRYSTESLKI